jgi:hypothetical protein
MITTMSIALVPCQKNDLNMPFTNFSSIANQGNKDNISPN